MSEPVVEGPRGRIADHAVRLPDLLEERLGAHVPEIHVGRVAAGEPPVRPADLQRRRLPRDPQHLVVVALGHARAPVTRPGPWSVLRTEVLELRVHDLTL